MALLISSLKRALGPLSVRKALRRKLIESGIIKQKTLSINGRDITFTDLKQAKLLISLALDGPEAHETEVVTLIKNYPWEPAVFFDIGANVGLYSILGELYFPRRTKVVAVEPFPKNAAYIRKIKQLNNLNFEVIETAVDGTERQQKEFYYPTSANSSRLPQSASLINSFEGSNGLFKHLPCETVAVQCTTLPVLLQDHPGPRLVKLDCEGSELSILEASASILEDAATDFIIEIMINDEDKHELFALMQKFDYSAYLITHGGLVREDRPLTLPCPGRKNRTMWQNHFFTKRDVREMEKVSRSIYGYWI